MNKDTVVRQEWSKPQLTRLGQIKDVAGKDGPGGQVPAGNKT
ncbi:MAG: hypothetical protein ABIP07_06590 [Sphingomicrobium sp.]